MGFGLDNLFLPDLQSSRSSESNSKPGQWPFITTHQFMERSKVDQRPKVDSIVILPQESVVSKQCNIIKENSFESVNLNYNF